jgi:hypothetical protein
LHAIRILALAAAALAFPPTAGAVRLVGTSFTDGLVYDVFVASGAAVNPRSVVVADPACPATGGSLGCVLDHPCGIEILPDRSWLLAPVASADDLQSHLVNQPVGPGIGMQTSVALDAQIGEGDLALDPLTGDLYAFGLTNLIAPFLLLRIEPGANGWADPTTTDVGVIGTSDVSAMAFDAAGNLWAIDTGNDALLLLDPIDASTIDSVALSEPLGALAGMDFDPESGTLYVADGGTGGQDALFTLDVETGTLDEIGPLGLENGLSGLAVPEPGAAALAGTAAACLWVRAHRRRRLG